VGILLAVVVVVALACLATFLLAGRIGRLLGHTGNIVLSRLLGVLRRLPCDTLSTASARWRRGDRQNQDRALPRSAFINHTWSP
jgi:hypothetical protein